MLNRVFIHRKDIEVRFIALATQMDKDSTYRTWLTLLWKYAINYMSISDTVGMRMTKLSICCERTLYVYRANQSSLHCARLRPV